jgi:hypothetical protein
MGTRWYRRRPSSHCQLHAYVSLFTSNAWHEAVHIGAGALSEIKHEMAERPYGCGDREWVFDRGESGCRRRAATPPEGVIPWWRALVRATLLSG